MISILIVHTLHSCFAQVARIGYVDRAGERADLGEWKRKTGGRDVVSDSFEHVFSP